LFLSFLSREKKEEGVKNYCMFFCLDAKEPKNQGCRKIAKNLLGRLQ
jgi:hypothetical protein